MLGDAGARCVRVGENLPGVQEAREKERERERERVCVCVLGAVLVTEGSGREGEDPCKGLRESRRYCIVCLPPEHKQGCSS